MFISFLLLLLFDQITKVTALHFLTFNSFPFLTLVKNRGVAFGFLSHDITIVTITNILILVFIWYFRKHFFGKSKLDKYAFVFIMAGGTGNALDRFFRKFVTDFLYIHPIPVFNFADVFLNIGIGLIILALFRHEKN